MSGNRTVVDRLRRDEPGDSWDLRGLRWDAADLIERQAAELAALGGALVRHGMSPDVVARGSAEEIASALDERCREALNVGRMGAEHDAAEEVAALRAELERARKERDALRDALEPFAQVPLALVDMPDDYRLWMVKPRHPADADFVLGDLRRAARAAEPTTATPREEASDA